MSIQWFPGHMHKARKEIKKVMSNIDVVIEVLDARIPFSSSNPMIKSLKADTPCIKLLNKSDLADPEQIKVWQNYFEQDANVKTLSISATSLINKNAIANLCRKLAPHKKDSDKAIQAMIMGIPNVGKSTLINSIAGRSIAKVGNEPAVTKRQQKIDLDNGIVLSDTPGVLWPKLEPVNCGYRLAATGAIKDTAMEYESVAIFALEYLAKAYPEALLSRFKLNNEALSSTEHDRIELLSLIGTKRGCLRSGGVVDLYQASTIVLNELRSGKLGQICLETPAIMEAEMTAFLAELEAKRAAEAEEENKDRQ